MKLKKLLAGVLSATMVATMIPASMAFSSVSAAPENSLVASYDLTTDIGREDWTGTEGYVSVDENGVSIAHDGETGKGQYYITNPLAGKDLTDGFSVVVDVAALLTDDAVWDTLFGFSKVNDLSAVNFFSVGNTGTTVRLNRQSENLNPYFFDIVGNPMLDSSTQRIVLSVSSEAINIYLDGNATPIASYSYNNTYAATEYSMNVIDYVDEAGYFILGAVASYWGNPEINVKSVAFYDTALTSDDVVSLGAYEDKQISVSYDLTTEEGRQGWTGTGYTVSDETGITLKNGSYTDRSRYYIENPLQGNSTGEFTVVLDVKVGELAETLNGKRDQALFGFSNHSGYTYSGVMATGAYVRSNNYGYFDTGLSTEVIDLSEMSRYVMTVSGNTVTIYKNGESQGQFTYAYSGDAAANTPATLAGRAASNDFFDLGEFAEGWDAGWYWAVSNGTEYKYVALYNTAMSAADVEKDYAKSIADDLEVTTVGMQKGSIGENSRSTRFVARVNAAAVDQYNAQIACLGWAYNAGDTLESYSVIDLNTVTSSTEGGLNADDSTYAFTYVVQGNEETPATQMAVAPYVGVTVNGNTYYFCYDGKTGSYTVESKVVEAPSPFNHVSNTAA